MNSPYSLSKPAVYVPLLAIQLFLIRTVSSLNLTNAYLHHICRVNEGTYTPGSKYEENLNFLTKSVGNEKFPKGFAHINYGEAPNSVAIIFQCRLDSYGSKCRSCFATAIAGLRRRCQKNKGAIIWYDQCFLDVSPIARPPPRKMEYENTFSMYNPNKINENVELFNKKIRNFLYNLTQQTEKFDVDGVNLLYYAAGEDRLETKKLYAMVQCVGDIVSCKDCLKWSIQQLPKCCDGKQGARVLGTSCNIRYELYPFLTK